MTSDSLWLRIYESRTSDLVQMTRAVSSTLRRNCKVTTSRAGASKRWKFFHSSLGESIRSAPVQRRQLRERASSKEDANELRPQVSCRTATRSTVLELLAPCATHSCVMERGDGQDASHWAPESRRCWPPALGNRGTGC
jgi:hypothetical protein